MKKILVIDDEEDLCDIVRLFLEEAGYEVMTATDGDQGLRLLQYSIPHLILLDLSMPVKDGLEVLDSIRHRPEAKNIPVIILTAKAKSTNILNTEELGIVDFLIKPVNRKDVLELIRRTIG